MSSAAEEFEVDAQLADWLDRHGVHARTGDRVRLELVPPPAKADPAYVDELWDAFIGSSHSDDPDLAFRAKEIVREEAATPDVLDDEVWGAFIGRFESPEPDLARRAKEIIRAVRSR